MSDNATLIKRLDAARMVLALGDMYPQHEAALIDAIARIAELEAGLRKSESTNAKLMRERTLDGWLARIAELEAECLSRGKEASENREIYMAEIKALRAGLEDKIGVDGLNRQLVELDQAKARIAELEAERDAMIKHMIGKRRDAVLAEREAIRKRIVERRSPFANLNERWTVDAILSDIDARDYG